MNSSGISAVPGIYVGHAHCDVARTGVTLILPHEPAVMAVDVRGGGPGTRETDALITAIATSCAFSIAGGGDTLAAIAKYGIEKQVDYISTGGGAFLEVLEGKTLPAFEILQKRAAG